MPTKVAAFVVVNDNKQAFLSPISHDTAYQRRF